MIRDISAREEERAFAEVKRVSSAGLEGPELLSRVALSLGHAVPFGAYCASTVDPATNLMTYGVIDGMGEGSAEDDAVFFNRIYFEESLGRSSESTSMMAIPKRPGPVSLSGPASVETASRVPSGDQA